MMVFKRKQIVVLSLVLMIIFAGYLQYSYKKSSMSVSGKDNGRLGDAVYVDSEKDASAAGLNEKKENKNIKDKNTKAAAASKQANDFFAQAKLDKEITRSKAIDDLKSISNDPNASKEAKAKAYDHRMKIVQNNDREMRIETLLRDKGFSEVVALFGDDGSVDIVVKAPSLNSADAAKIADIVTRHANVDMTKLHIKNIY
ncbi:MAG: SpoIIIAH-like family protein [Clostridia bacterium]|nr:SpoIIIAH-like family protein [Clostridia bacterium]